MDRKPYQGLIPTVGAAVLSLILVPQLSFGHIPPSNLLGVPQLFLLAGDFLAPVLTAA